LITIPKEYLLKPSLSKWRRTEGGAEINLALVITKKNLASHRPLITFLFMDKKVTKKTIWPQFRITLLTDLGVGIE
jgi:hypothetical protein